MTSFIPRIVILWLVCASAGFAQQAVILQSFKSNWIEDDPIRKIYQRGMDLIDQQSAMRTAEGWLLKSVSWHWDTYTKTWALSSQLLNTYNPENQLIGDIGQQWVNDRWVDQYRTTYVYNDAGLVSMFQYEAWNGINWDLYVRFLHEYDSENRLHTFIAQDWIDNRWVSRYKRNFEFNETLHYVREIRQYWINEAWENAVRYGYYYDDHGRLKCNMHYIWDGIDWVYAERNLVDYGCYSFPVHIMQQQYESHAWLDRTDVTLSYNDSAQLISELHHYIEADPEKTDKGWTFDYDAPGNLTERTFWSAAER